MEELRSELLSAQAAAIASICHHYSGQKKDMVLNLLQQSKILEAYYIITQASIAAHVETKNALFVNVRNNIGILRCKAKGHQTMHDKRRTERTSHFLALLLKIIPWWMSSENVDTCIENRTALTAALKSEHYGKVNPFILHDMHPKDVGSYIHDGLGTAFIAECADLFGWRKLQHVIPGRMVHSGLPFFGVTPDGLSVVDIDAFHYITQKFYNGEPVSEKERAAGSPWMTMELKTVHVENKMHSDGTLHHATVHVTEMESLLEVYENDTDAYKLVTKEKALALLVRKLEVAKWFPEGSCAREGPSTCGSVQKSPSRKQDAFFKKSTILYPTAKFKKLPDFKMGHAMYPNLTYMPLEKHMR